MRSQLVQLLLWALIARSLSKNLYVSDTSRVRLAPWRLGNRQNLLSAEQQIHLKQPMLLRG